jgi:RecA/RadA recombinase
MAKRKVINLDELVQELQPPPAEYIRTGCVPFDMITGGNGMALYSTYMLWCDKGMGKSTLLLSVCRSLAERGYKSLYVASEANTKLAEDMGLFTDGLKGNFSLTGCVTYAELESLFWAFLESDRTLMVIDSITAVVPSKMNDEGSIEDYNIGVVARIRGEFLRVMNGNMQRVKKTIVFLNQARANFDAGWGGESTIPEGGYSNEHYANIVVTIRGDSKVQDIVSGDTKKVVGKIGYLYTTKNRAALPFVKIPLELFFGKGASNIYSCSHYALWKGLIVGKGGWFECGLGDGVVDKVQGRAERNQWVKDRLHKLQEMLFEDREQYFSYLASYGHDAIKV